MANLSSLILYLFKDQKYQVYHKGKVPALISLRGFAALSVLFFHAFLTFQVNEKNPAPFNFYSIENIINSVILHITNGSAAVVFFFVHSGFVLMLALSYRFQNTSKNFVIIFMSYLVRRFLRLYPVIFTTSVIGLMYVNTISPITPQPGSQWVSNFFSEPANFQTFLYSISLLSLKLNQFIWSLSVEYQISILMPFLTIFCRRKYTIVACLLSFIILIHTQFGNKLFDWTKPNSDGFGIHKFIFFYCICFLIGASGTLIKPLKLNRLGCELEWFIPLIILIGTRSIVGFSGYNAIIIEGLASIFIIRNVYYGAGSTLSNVANNNVSIFFGNISYSLYMLSTIGIHLSAKVVLLILPTSLVQEYGLLANILVAIIAIFLIVPASWLQFSFLEQPFMKLGRQISGHLEKKS